jgi:hypothetical protein
MVSTNELRCFEFQKFVADNDVINEHYTELLPLLRKLEDEYLDYINMGHPIWYKGSFIVKNKLTLPQMINKANINRTIALNMIKNIITLNDEEIRDIDELIYNFFSNQVVMPLYNEVDNELPFYF